MHSAAQQQIAAAELVVTDAATVASVGVTVFVLGNIIHEALGHGGACLVVGARPISVNAVSMDCSVDNRLVLAGGTLMNLIAGFVFWALGRAAGVRYAYLRYFLWLAMTVNLYAAAGYFLFSGIGGFGDWAEFIKGLEPQWAWRAAMAVFGAAAYMGVAYLSIWELRSLIGSDRRRRYAHAVRLSRIPYFAGGIVECLAGLLNPVGLSLVLLSAAASTFGGSSGLLWAPQWLHSERFSAAGDALEPVSIRRSWAWIAAAVIVAVAFIVFVGPGVHFNN